MRSDSVLNVDLPFLKVLKIQHYNSAEKNAGLYPFPKGVNYHVKCDSGGLKMLKIQPCPSAGESVECVNSIPFSMG